ncbi:MAG: sunset domain-containing protein [Peptoanaerobacter stomatis]
MPSGAYYNKVSDENAVYFDTEEDAKKAGYRASER